MTEDSIEVCVSFLQDLSLCFSVILAVALRASGFGVQDTLGFNSFIVESSTAVLAWGRPTGLRFIKGPCKALRL